MRPATLVRVCDECNYGSYAGRCVICGGIGASDAYYCKECTVQEKDVSLGYLDISLRDISICLEVCIRWIVIFNFYIQKFIQKKK